MTRRRIDRNIYRDRSGYAVRWTEGGHRQEQRFPLDTPRSTLVEFRDEQERRAAPTSSTSRGLARDVVRFLRLRKGRPSYQALRSHLRVWVHRFPHKSRWGLTRQDCQQAIAAWQQEGKAPQTIWHRVKALRQVYTALDGPDIRTPLDHLDLPKRPRPRPASVPDRIVQAVALELLAHERVNWLRDAKTRARYLVLATTGQRPAQLMRAVPEDVDLERRLWFVRPAKGDRGSIVALNDEMVAAWRLFAEADAWGAYNGRSFVRVLHRCGWPKGIRPYNLRHTVGTMLSGSGVDIGDIAAHMGHSSVDVTRQFYVPTQIDRLRRASAVLSGRVPGATVPHAAATNDDATKQHRKELRRKLRETRDGTAPSAEAEPDTNRRIS